jgi:hypothetical protein
VALAPDAHELVRGDGTSVGHPQQAPKLQMSLGGNSTTVIGVSVTLQVLVATLNTTLGITLNTILNIGLGNKGLGVMDKMAFRHHTHPEAASDSLLARITDTHL